MRKVVLPFAMLLGACAQPDVDPGTIPVAAIRELMRAECADQGLSSMAIAIARDGGAPAELGVGSVTTQDGAMRDPIGVYWAVGGVPHRLSPPRLQARGTVWCYEQRVVPGPASAADPTAELTELAGGAHDAVPSFVAGGATVVVTGGNGWSMALATDTWPAPAPLQRVAHRALALLCERAPTSAPAPLHTVDRARTRALVGRYHADGGDVEVLEIAGEPWLVPEHGPWQHLRGARDPEVLVARDRLNVERRVRVAGDSLELDGVLFARIEAPLPACPPDLAPLLGAYGDRDPPLLVLERHGRLRALGPDLCEHGLTPIDGSARDFVFTDRGTTALRFETDAHGRLRAVPFDPTTATDTGAPLVRQDVAAGTFRIEPLHRPDELRRLAAAAEPPPPPPDALSFDLVELSDLDPTIRYDIRYATADNFLGFAVYDAPSARMQRPAAEALVRAHRRLAALGFGILVHDAYRPWRVTKMFWDATPAHLRMFVADPTQGSRHNRGCAADITLFELGTGAAVTMPSGYDEFTPRAYPAWPGGTGRSRALRDLLRRTMEDEGFAVYEAEWWHFDFRDWQRYPVR